MFSVGADLPGLLEAVLDAFMVMVFPVWGGRRSVVRRIVQKRTGTDRYSSYSPSCQSDINSRKVALR